MENMGTEITVVFEMFSAVVIIDMLEAMQGALGDMEIMNTTQIAGMKSESCGSFPQKAIFLDGDCYILTLLQSCHVCITLPGLLAEGHTLVEAYIIIFDGALFFCIRGLQLQATCVRAFCMYSLLMETAD